MSLKILDLIDHARCKSRARVPDNVARMVSDVLAGGDDADKIFERYARVIVTGAQANRRLGIEMLEKAFPGQPLRSYLKERMICNQSD